VPSLVIVEIIVLLYLLCRRCVRVCLCSVNLVFCGFTAFTVAGAKCITHFTSIVIVATDIFAFMQV